MTAWIGSDSYPQYCLRALVQRNHGLALHQLDAENTVHRIRGLLRLRQLEAEIDRRFADFILGLVDGGERRLRQSTESNIVEANQGDVVRNLPARLAQGAHGAEG